jgi:hypothetical protein
MVAIDGTTLRLRNKGGIETGMSYAININVVRGVSTTAWPSESFVAIAWEKNLELGVVADETQLKDNLRSTLTDMAQQLANEILKANGR